MSKYDFELDLDSENSLSLIVDMIKPESKVLEFGPAHGRVTKYLKEIMNCTIDIVELDEESGLEAAKYANRYFVGEKLGNIENYLWLDKLKDERYDYIVFADVLEHLYWPDKVLKKCKTVLKDEGSILISVPNVAHNSIIIDLINNEFKYNQLGLLDDTHIRFFTYNSLLRMLSEVGLVTTNEKATYSGVGENEIINSYNSINNDIAKPLKLREKGNIYQFVFEVKKKEYYLRGSSIRSINLDKSSSYEMICYIKDGNEYTENKTVRKSIHPDRVEEIIDLQKYKIKNEIRIDPITSNCIVDLVEIYTIQNNQKIDLSVKYTNADINYKNRYFFSTEDPQIYVELGNLNINNIFLNYRLIDYDSKRINETINTILKINSSNDENIKETQKFLKEKDQNIDKLHRLLKEKNYEIKTLLNDLQQKEKYIKNIENTKVWILLQSLKKIIGK